MMKSFSSVLWVLAFFGVTQISNGAIKQIVCPHYVVQNIPFCKVTLKIREGDKLESSALIDHQGQVFPSQIQELPLEDGQRFHLNLDADKPGQEIEMIVHDSPSEKGEYPSVLINHDAPFAKEMHGICADEINP